MTSAADRRVHVVLLVNDLTLDHVLMELAITLSVVDLPRRRPLPRLAYAFTSCSS